MDDNGQTDFPTHAVSGVPNLTSLSPFHPRAAAVHLAGPHAGGGQDGHGGLGVGERHAAPGPVLRAEPGGVARRLVPGRADGGVDGAIGELPQGAVEGGGMLLHRLRLHHPRRGA